jgi:ribosome-binding protein aMBF1 (putative translation factor)
VTTTSDRRTQIVESLRDKEYRDALTNAYIDRGLAFQIRAMQEARGWTQKALGERVGMAQGTISNLESPDYGKHTLSTLKRLASAFDVALMVRFVPFSQLADCIDGLSAEDMAVPAFDEKCTGNTCDLLLPG